MNTIRVLSSEKAPGSDIIPKEIYKAGGQQMTENPIDFHCRWRQEAISQEFKDATLIHQYIRKKKKKKLQSVTTIEASLYVIVYCGEDTGKILLNRRHEHLDQAEIQPESQCGFRKDRRTIYVIFSIKHF